MASKRQEDDGHQSFNILGRNPKFFKTIVQDTLQEGRLGLPKKFVKKHGDCLSNRVIIKVADGTTWKMELFKGGKYEAWLQKGWKEFEEHYSLKHGYLLLFKFINRSNFLVSIFDTTLMEIEYPIKPNFIPNLEQNPNSNPNLEQNPSSSPNLVKIEDSDSENLESEGILNESKGGISCEAADKFSSQNPWCKVVLKPYYRGKLFTLLSLPMSFIREYMDSKLETVILKIEGGKSHWPVKFIVNWKHCYARLGTGWAAFVDDNCLKNGDVCVFELVARNELKVHIFRQMPLNA